MVRMLAALLVTALFFTGFQNPALAEDHGKPPVEELEEQFSNLFNVETEENNYVKDYDTLAEMRKVFENIMTPDLAKKTVETFFKEVDGRLMFLPQDSEAKLLSDVDYELRKIDDNHYKLLQTAELEIYGGTYRLEIDYIYESGKWIFADRSRFDNVEEETTGDDSTNTTNEDTTGDKLPNTATSLPTSMMIGGGIMLAGAFLLLARRRSKA
ncbi:LPXTG cell wall anchor domain-containing protein [Alkalihalobacillus sp. R86527]|uniref:LPXTG cell wall anchor domain-containing protein n=1 Tax=Alkalihalobacillus sp. R86527 TaxID=3093863 RepID=UPI00366FA83D